MATKAQRRLQQARRKEAKRAKEQKRQKIRSQPAGLRLAKRMSARQPTAWPDENEADVAVFEDCVLAKLSAEDAAEVRLIRDGLAEACDRRPGDAVEALQSIGRRSPVADWRLLIRGLLLWNESKVAEAGEVWQRLDPQRRPHRIAAALMLAHRDDLTELKQGDADRPPDDPWIGHSDTELLDSAKLIRQSQVDRVALRAARSILSVPKEFDDATVEPNHIDWMVQFTKDYESIEPRLIQSMHETIVRRAFCGPYSDIFKKCVERFNGPPHDRRNQLLTYHYFNNVGDDMFASRSPRRSSDALLKYLNVDLKANTELPKPLKGAIASQIHLYMAAEAMMPSSPFEAMMSRNEFELPSETAIEHFKAAVDANPDASRPYDIHEGVYRDLLEHDQIKKAEEREVNDLLIEIWQKRLQHRPDDVDVRVRLVDQLLEMERSAEAQQHIESLAGNRQENPLAAAMDWKWHVLETFRLCRRKTWLSQAEEHLRAAADRWPSWLATDWLPYLHAGLAMRGGNTRAFDQMAKADVAKTPIDDACMRLAAAQRMRIAAAELKPLRGAINDCLREIESTAVDKILPAASFFWDLHRTGLKYPAYRMHGTKFLNQLVEWFETDPSLVAERIDQPPIRAALLILANEGFFNDGYDIRLLTSLTDHVAVDHPVNAAVTLTAVCRRTHTWEDLSRDRPMAQTLLHHAKTETDPFYRHHYQSLVEAFEQKVLSVAKRMGGMNMFSRMIDAAFGEDSGDECQCDKCRRRRGEQ